jgi:hypothetical protein
VFYKLFFITAPIPVKKAIIAIICRPSEYRAQFNLAEN